VKIFLTLICLTLALAPKAMAEVHHQPLETTKIDSTWNTSAHLGFAVETKSSGEFKDSGGSLALFTMQHQFSRYFSLGWHTLGSGAQAHSERFYRLATGPLLAVHPFANSDLLLAAGGFSESAKHVQSNELLYRAKGQHLVVGWLRHFPVNSRFWISWGALFGIYHGSITPVLPAAVGGSQAPKHRAENRALTIAVRFVL